MSDDSMKLPDGFTCADCQSVNKCTGMFGVKREAVYCDFHPVRFCFPLSGIIKLREENERLKEAAGIYYSMLPSTDDFMADNVENFERLSELLEGEPK